MYILALAAVVVGIGSFFKISDIQVSGNVIYSAQDILKVVDIKPGDNLFLFSKRAVEEAVLENCGFADTVTVKRRLPDVIEINVRESKLLACVECEGVYYILDRKCEILSKTDAYGAAGHILISGVQPLAPKVGEQLTLGEAERSKEDYLADVMEQMMEQDIYSHVQWIDASNVSSLKFLYQERITVDLGKNEALDRKFAMLENILADRAENDRGTIDLAKLGEGHFIPES